jgi:hypothetical protein
VDYNNIRTPDEEFWYWFYKVHNIIDEKLPWDMHPNEIRAAERRVARMEKKMYAALDSEEYKEHNS